MKKSIKAAICITAAITAVLSIGGCGAKNYKDGTYTAQSSVYEGIDDDNGDEGGNGYGVVTLTVSGNKVTACEFKTYEPDGTPKDNEDYGKKDGEIANRDYYNKAQKAVAANAVYSEALVAAGSLDGVDAVSGATISYGEFTEAVRLALRQAEQ